MRSSVPLSLDAEEVLPHLPSVQARTVHVLRIHKATAVHAVHTPGAGHTSSALLLTPTILPLLPTPRPPAPADIHKSPSDAVGAPEGWRHALLQGASRAPPHYDMSLPFSAADVGAAVTLLRWSDSEEAILTHITHLVVDDSTGNVAVAAASTGRVSLLDLDKRGEKMVIGW